jgi:hypothetical protein
MPSDRISSPGTAALIFATVAGLICRLSNRIERSAGNVQGVKGVDATSSATITSEAIINATAKALSAAAKKTRGGTP